MNTAPLSLAAVRRALGAHRATILPVDRPHAAVAMLLVDGTMGAEVLFILRAAHHADPWSGDIGFPGGRVAAADGDPRVTAERETREELALDLGSGEFLGRLDDLCGLALPMLVSCFVYAFPARPALTPNHEVARAFWSPLNELHRAERHRMATFPWRGESTTQEVAEILGPGEPLLWGITYRLLGNFFGIMRVPFGARRAEGACLRTDPR